MRTPPDRNQTRWVRAVRIGLSGLILLLFIGAVVNLLTTFERGAPVYDAALLMVVPVALALQLYDSRLSARRTRHRAIRAEEALRHYLLVGTPLDARLTLQQIVALRSAPDAAFGELARRAADEAMPPDAIARAIARERVGGEQG